MLVNQPSRDTFPHKDSSKWTPMFSGLENQEGRRVQCFVQRPVSL